MSNNLAPLCRAQMAEQAQSASMHKLSVLYMTAGAPNWLADQVLQQLSTATVDILTPLLSNPTPHSVTPTSVSPFTRVGSLLDSLQPAADQQLLLQHVARPIATALIGPVQQGNAPAEASSLLARVIKQFGAEVVAHGATAGLPTGDQAAGSSFTLSLPAACMHNSMEDLLLLHLLLLLLFVTQDDFDANTILF